jgi:hypothetical protein
MLLIGNEAFFMKSNCFKTILSLVSFTMEYANMTIWITVSLILWMVVIEGIYTTLSGSWLVYTKLQTVTKSPDFL